MRKKPTMQKTERQIYLNGFIDGIKHSIRFDEKIYREAFRSGRDPMEVILESLKPATLEQVFKALAMRYYRVSKKKS